MFRSDLIVVFKNITLMTIVCRDRDYGSITSLVNNEVTLGLHISEKFTPHQMVKTANKFFYWLLKYHKVQSSSITIQHGARRKDFSQSTFYVEI